jgi:hypothetical protein
LLLPETQKPALQQPLQSELDEQPAPGTQVPVFVLQASPGAQSVARSHATHCFNVRLQRGVAPPQSAAASQPQTNGGTLSAFTSTQSSLFTVPQFTQSTLVAAVGTVVAHCASFATDGAMQLPPLQQPLQSLVAVKSQPPVFPATQVSVVVSHISPGLQSLAVVHPQWFTPPVLTHASPAALLLQTAQAILPVPPEGPTEPHCDALVPATHEPPAQQPLQEPCAQLPPPGTGSQRCVALKQRSPGSQSSPMSQPHLSSAARQRLPFVALAQSLS